MSHIAQYLSAFTQKEIRAIFRSAKRAYKGPGLDILVVPAALQYGRILVITPRKVGTAPERNRVRRRLKAIFYQEQLYNHKLDCFVIIKKPGIQFDHDELKSKLSPVLKQEASQREISQRAASL